MGTCIDRGEASAAVRSSSVILLGLGPSLSVLHALGDAFNSTLFLLWFFLFVFRFLGLLKAYVRLANYLEPMKWLPLPPCPLPSYKNKIATVQHLKELLSS